ncbi:hypothetical protein M011DRAFT_489613 [Sporormia fimetaria CBS 119925]|uniref:SprT-like domain-containing protein n=1 Tax=Sporormia fimetaria CBS 119925 TaxID=1340428 RepID=A0A6A6UZI2_9PLEO|nr:hypothetical protein M011DRAFT_489613 [Sporormia fimetaria CBS 119925]
MARLRKAPGSSEPIQLPPPQETPRTSRRSPSKTVVPYTSDSDVENSRQEESRIRTRASRATPSPRSMDVETPRTRRALRPVANNSRLIKEPSIEESFATPERRERRERLDGREKYLGMGHLYSAKRIQTPAKRILMAQEDSDEDAFTMPAIVTARSFAREKDEVEETKSEIKPRRKEQRKPDDSVLSLGLSRPQSLAMELDIQAELQEQAESDPEQNPRKKLASEKTKQDESVQSVYESDNAEEEVEEVEEVSTHEALEDDQASEQSEENDEYNSHGDDEEDEEDEDDSVIDARYRRHREDHRPSQDGLYRQRQTESEEEEEPEDPEPMEQPRRQAPGDEWDAGEDQLPALTSLRPWTQDVVDLIKDAEPPSSFVHYSRPSAPDASGSRPTSSYSNDGDAVLSFSPTPTKQRSPRKAPPLERPRTPPLTDASPKKLVSPSKKGNRIPKAPNLRPSLDAFWCPAVINTWNEMHSPAKTLLSPRKQKLLRQMENLDLSSDSDDSFAPKSASPRKKEAAKPKTTSRSRSPSPAKERAQRKAFETTKHDLAVSFLSELDATITQGRIATMCAPTGGIKLIWSKTLKTTAGRANWRREKIRLRMGPHPTDIRTEYRHVCSIELAEKVIDNDERLCNVLAHEYCHLTTFMISEVSNNPHGAEFKSWAHKVSRAFAHKNVHVTTKHSYQIAYKYVWECVGCGYEYKRHSKSVDPVRHSCGKCKGRLLQTKPTPRGAGAKKDGKEKSEYQVFVKENFKKVKERLEKEGRDAKLGNVMAVVAEEYKSLKEKRAGEAKRKIVEVESLFEGLRIEDEDT